MSQPWALNIDLASRYAKWLVAQKYAAGTRSQYCLAVKEYSDFLGAKSFTTIHTENSYKFNTGMIDEMLTAAGFSVTKVWTDPLQTFALTLAAAR